MRENVKREMNTDISVDAQMFRWISRNITGAGYLLSRDHLVQLLQMTTEAYGPYLDSWPMNKEPDSPGPPSATSYHLMMFGCQCVEQ